MKKLLFVFLILSFILYHSSFLVFAQSLPDQPLNPSETYISGKVLKIQGEKTITVGGFTTITQTLLVQLLDGPQKGQTVTIQKQIDSKLLATEKIQTNTTVVIDALFRPGNIPLYTITDTNRLTPLLFIGLAFFLLTIGIAGRKGFGAVVGLCVSLAIILLFMIPQILNHQDPLLISIISCTAILLITTYLAHGFSKQTTLAVISTFLSLVIAYLFALLSVHIAHLSGLGTEDSYLLELSPSQFINPQGLLLGGILIGTLGALNDITTTQVASIFAIHKQNPKLSLLHLAEQGFLIGREHIASLVNTLVLAYAGASLPLFIFFVLNPSHVPWWVMVNNQQVSEEIVRTIAGSIGLVCAVPITTFLASWWVVRKNIQ